MLLRACSQISEIPNFLPRSSSGFHKNTCPGLKFHDGAFWRGCLLTRIMKFGGKAFAQTLIHETKSRRKDIMWLTRGGFSAFIIFLSRRGGGKKRRHRSVYNYLHRGKWIDQWRAQILCIGRSLICAWHTHTSRRQQGANSVSDRAQNSERARGNVRGSAMGFCVWY
jgi:hypothetical protein